MSSFRDIKADIIRRISGEEWTPGSRIPNEIDLARSYGTARATVNRAMAELVDDGIVERRRKAGTFVRDVPLRQVRLSIPIVRSEIEQNGASYRYVLLQSSIGPAPEWLQARLALPSTVGKRLASLTVSPARASAMRLPLRDGATKITGPDESRYQGRSI